MPHNVIEVICLHVIQSTITIKPGIITELIQILKSNLCTITRVLSSNILTHYCTLASLNRVHFEHFQKKPPKNRTVVKKKKTMIYAQNGQFFIG